MKDRCITRVDTLSQDIVTNAEETLKVLVDLKTQLHRDRIDMQETNDTVTEQMMTIDQNTQILESKIKQME